MTLIWPFKVTKRQSDYAIRFATYKLLLVFYSNYSAISHGNPVFQQMTLIWLFKVTKGQSDYAILFATYDLLLVFYSNYSAISHGSPVFSRSIIARFWEFAVMSDPVLRIRANENFALMRNALMRNALIRNALMRIVLVAAYPLNITFEILKYSIDSTSTPLAISLFNLYFKYHFNFEPLFRKWYMALSTDWNCNPPGLFDFDHFSPK